MQATAKARYIRVTPRKARRVVELIRGLPAEEARAVLAFAPQSASDPVAKVLASAIANAEHSGERPDPASTQAKRPADQPPPWPEEAVGAVPDAS